MKNGLNACRWQRQPRQEIVKMFSPDRILTWLEDNVKGMRRSRMKTMAAIVPAAMELCGIGLLTLGRVMCTHTTAKHNIKRVGRFLGNERVESECIARGLFEAFAPCDGRVLVLADWTDVVNGKLLVFALPCNGRSVPFYTKVVPKHAGDGGLIRAENEALSALKGICDSRPDVIVVADRGFGNQRWLQAIGAQGFHFVQRLSNVFFVDTEHHIGALKELDLRRGRKVRDWGHGSIGEDGAIIGRLVTAYDRKAKEPWYLVTDLNDADATEVVNIYRRRWWIETLFRDKKNRDWGMGLAAVQFKDYRRYERLFYIVAMGFVFLTAHGAAAENEGFDRGLKANTRKTRVINLLRMGYHFIRKHGEQLEFAIDALRILVTRQRAPNWG
jgi:hypothetical protein